MSGSSDNSRKPFLGFFRLSIEMHYTPPSNLPEAASGRKRSPSDYLFCLFSPLRVPSPG